jgi:hypothetical protein
VAANQLLAGLDLQLGATVGTDPQFDQLFRFDASANTYRAGVRFDAPLNRFAERNAYRAAQIAYQQARREYMRTRDGIVRQLRLDVRNLLLTRRQFEISREQYVIAARAVEETEYNLRTLRDVNAGAGFTQQFLNVLNQLLDSKNALIGLWVQYETTRMTLYANFGIMDIDAQGVWTNDGLDPAALVPRRDGDLPGGGTDQERLEREIAPDIFGIEAPPDARAVGEPAGGVDAGGVGAAGDGLPRLPGAGAGTGAGGGR